MLIISDFVIEHFSRKAIENVFMEKSVAVKLEFLHEESGILNSNFQKDIYDMVILWFGYQEFSGYSEYEKSVEDDLYEQYIRNLNKIKEKMDSLFIIMGFDSYAENLSLLEGSKVIGQNLKKNLTYKLAQNLPEDVIMLDLDMIIARVGFEQAYSMSYKLRWKCPYRKAVFDIWAKELLKQYEISQAIIPKCVVLDCDNVLWGGTLAEDGIEGIKLGGLGKGNMYKDFQRVMFALYNRGVLLCLASKNEREEIEAVFEKHSGMILKKKHIVCMEANWESKANSILRISQQLNISLDSIVFIDDSANEIALVNEKLPEVNTILFEIKTIWEQIRAVFSIDSKYRGENVIRRNETYISNVKRNQLRGELEDYKQYLKELKTVVEIKEAEDSEYGRISELSLRTNKCTIGRRYNIQELKKVMRNPYYTLYSVNMSDRYGDFGIVAAIGVAKCEEGDKLDLFCVSCRALGREVEHTLLIYILNRYPDIEIVMTPTQKNNDFLSYIKQICEMKN